MSISRVAIAGATGNLGPAIVEQLVEAGFTVTALTRKSSTHTFPTSIKLAAVDYDSVESLATALEGQDAVVSTLGSEALKTQTNLVDAAVKAGVKRLIPSEFGSNTMNPKARALPVFRDKVTIQEKLNDASTKSGLSYTLLMSGPFFDWGIKVGFIMNVPKRNAVLYDGGNNLFSTSRLSTIGKAVAGVLKKPEETKNRAVYIQDTAITMKQLVSYAQKATSETNWDISTMDTQVLEKDAYAELGLPKPDPHKFVLPFIKCSIWGAEFGCHFDNVDNELLGIPQMSEIEIETMLAGFA